MSTAQNMLDDLHALSHADLYVVGIPKQEHLDQIKLVKQKLRLVKRQLRQEQAVIKKRWDGRNRYEAAREELELLPFELIDDLIVNLEVSLSDLEIAVKYEQPFPISLKLPDIVILPADTDGRTAYVMTFEAALNEFGGKADQLKRRAESISAQLSIMPSPNPIITWGCLIIGGINVLLALASTGVSLVFFIMVAMVSVGGLWKQLEKEARQNDMERQGREARQEYYAADRMVQRIKEDSVKRDFDVRRTRLTDAVNRTTEIYKRLLDEAINLPDGLPTRVSTANEARMLLKQLQQQDHKLAVLLQECYAAEQAIRREFQAATPLLKDQKISQPERSRLSDYMNEVWPHLKTIYQSTSHVIKDLHRQFSEAKLQLNEMIASPLTVERDSHQDVAVEE